MPLPALKAIAAIGRKIQALPAFERKATEKIVLDSVGINGSLRQHLMEAAGE
jgi:hypothetical protein